MKASKMIERLQELMAKHGDMEVLTWDYEYIHFIEYKGTDAFIFD